MTNWGKIKQMSAEEFTNKRHLIACACCEQVKTGGDPMRCTKKRTDWLVSPCDDCFLSWLESEAEE